MATANVPTGIPANVMPPNVNVNNVPAPAAAPRPVQVPEDVQSMLNITVIKLTIKMEPCLH